VSALAAVSDIAGDGPVRHRHWDIVVARAPEFAVTAWRYLDQLAVSMRPATVNAE
jgi:hypothetical protein